MDQNNDMQHGPERNGSQHWGHWGHGHHLLRWLIGLVILAVVFCIGVKVGRFSSEFEGYGHGYYHGRDFRMMENQYPPMMYGNTPAQMMPAATSPGQAQPGTPAPAPQPTK